MDYTPAFVLAILSNNERIDSFLESTTAILTPSQYATSSKEAADFVQQEGHTLWNTGPRTTHIPSKGGLRENLIIWRADIYQARKTLTLEEDAALMKRAARKAGKPAPNQTVLRALEKICLFLNNEEEF